MALRLLRLATGAAVALAIAFALYALARSRPQDLPWTRLDLGEPIGLFTGRKLAALHEDARQCEALLGAAGVRYHKLPSVHLDSTCGYDDAVRFEPGGPRRIAFAPASVGVSCPVAAALSMWEWNVVQPAAEKRFGARVTRIDHFGSYSCRRLYGRATGDWSEHARANAIDVAGFQLSNGERVTVAGDWRGEGAKAAFLRDVRDGGCRLFATVLSPDYNAAHHDHLHLDQAARGAVGWRACR